MTVLSKVDNQFSEIKNVVNPNQNMIQGIEEKAKLFFNSIQSMENIDILQLEKAYKEHIEPLDDLPFLLQLNLSVISVFISKASFINELANHLNDLVLEHFWKGEMDIIAQLYDENTQSIGERYRHFIKKWTGKLIFSESIEVDQLISAKNINSSLLNNLIKTIQVNLTQAINKYIHSIKNIWFEGELLQDRIKFYEKVEEIRTMILTTQEFLKDMEVLFVEEKVDQRLHEDEKNSEEAPDIGLTSFLHKKPESDNSILFFNKVDIFTGNPTLFINENNLDKLASYLSNGNKNKKEISNLIRIIYGKSMTKGFTVREIVRTFFISKYDNRYERKDFEQRYDIKRLFVKSTLENVFETLMDKLKDLNIINVEQSVIQAKQQEKISFNYNFQIYDKE